MAEERTVVRRGTEAPTCFQNPPQRLDGARQEQRMRAMHVVTLHEAPLAQARHPSPTHAGAAEHTASAAHARAACR